MKFNRRARLDSSEVRSRRGGAAAVGGGVGIVGVVVVLALQLLGGGGGDLGGALSALEGVQAGGERTEAVEGCRTGADAAERQECRIVAFVNSIQDHWSTTIEGYRPAVTNFFSGSVSTQGCGSASSAVGPFYCPADRATGPESDAVRLELQADCFAGVWANRATTTPDPVTGEILILELTEQDVTEALDAAAAVGDDRIQDAATGQVTPESWTHGSAAQRQRWFLTGYERGDPAACDTFAAAEL